MELPVKLQFRNLDDVLCILNTQHYNTYWVTQPIATCLQAAHKFIVLKVPTEVAKFSTHGYNYPDNFIKLDFLLHTAQTR